ncbi:MAG: HEAT repeat domain-containing protein [Pirellulaceae bacterium]
MANRVKSLIQDLTATDAAVRAAAAEQLAQQASTAQDAAVALVVATGDSDETVAEWAVSALEGLGAPHADDQQRIGELLASPLESTAYWAATLLGRLGGDAAPSVAALIGPLERSPHASVRQRAAWALGEIGAAALPASDALRACAEDSDPRLSQLARRALESFPTK